MSQESAVRSSAVEEDSSGQEPEIGRIILPTAEATEGSQGESLLVSAPESGMPSWPAAASPFPHTFDFLLDVRITVSVEVGRVQMPVRQVMELGPGAVIELQRSASEPVEIHANGRCIGRGEVVIVGEQFGVRITELGPTA